MPGTIITNSLVGTYDPNVVDGGPGTILREANNDDQQALDRLAGNATFKVQATTDSTEVLAVMNLSELGVTFPVNSVRNVRTRAWARNNAGTKVAYAESLVPIIGNGSTAPALSAVTALSNASIDPRYVARWPIVGNAGSSTATYIQAIPAVTGGEVVIRCTGVTSVDLRWHVEVEVGAFKLLPVASASASQ
jgi:hypothetical protein